MAVKCECGMIIPTNDYTHLFNTLPSTYMCAGCRQKHNKHSLREKTNGFRTRPAGSIVER